MAQTYNTALHDVRGELNFNTFQPARNHKAESIAGRILLLILL
jgi:hypothetical protein